MSSCLGYALTQGNDGAFSIDASSVTFGPGCLAEVGESARALGVRRAALFTDERLVKLDAVDVARRSLERAGLEVEVYAEVRIEPTDVSFREATKFAAAGR